MRGLSIHKIRRELPVMIAAAGIFVLGLDYFSRAEVKLWGWLLLLASIVVASLQYRFSKRIFMDL